MFTLTATSGVRARSRDNEAEALINRMSKGDITALGELYELISTDVFAYALSKTANKDDAEDIAQDTFVQVWKNATQYKAIGKPLAWIFTIEMNLIRRNFNKNQRFISKIRRANRKRSHRKRLGKKPPQAEKYGLY